MKIIISNSSRGAYRGVVEELRGRLKEQNIVIAPDRFTASCERGLIQSLGISSTFGIEVMSFTRLADRLVGKKIKKCLTPEGSVMLITQVIEEHRAELNYYGKVAALDGFANELYAALTAMRNGGISTEMLRARLDDMPPSLRAKTQDIALIYDSYLEMLGIRHSDSSTRLYALASHIAENPADVSGINFYCTDIYEFSAPELEILSELSKNALSLTVGIPSGYKNANARIYPDRIINKLKAISKDKVEIVENDEQLPPELDAISKQLFSYAPPALRVENNGRVQLRIAGDRDDEVLALALDVLAKIKSGGRYKDIEVFVSDIADYESEIKAVFSRYNIPFFIDKKGLLIEQAKVRYVLSAIAAIRGGFMRRDVLDLVKNPLFSSSQEGGEEAVFKFENYVLKYNIDRSRFKSEFTLKERNNDKNGDLAGENEVPEAVREKLMEVLSPFDACGEKGATVSETVAAVRAFIKSSAEAWEKYVIRLAELSEYYRKVAEQVDKKLDAVLDEIDDVLTGEIAPEKFERVFKSMLKVLKIALVPTYLDCVFVGDYDSRFMGAGDVYMLGISGDKVPRASGGGSVITVNDEDFFERIGLDVSPSGRQRILTDMYAVCDLLKKPHGKIVLSYPECGSSGALKPSSVFSELKGMLLENGRPVDAERIDFLHLAKYGGEENRERARLLLSTEKSCFFEVLKNGISERAQAEESVIYGSAYECLGADNKKKIRSVCDEPEYIEPLSAFKDSTSVSRLETFFGCPYAHYFQYILSLKKRKDGTEEGTENGIILHFILQRFFEDLKNGKIRDEAEIKELAYSYFDEAIEINGYEILLEKPETARILRRVKEEGVSVCSDLLKVYNRSEFKPVLLEARIGSGEIEPLALNVNGEEIKLRGIIDRVDMLGDKFVVIDYKTYKSADLTLKELYYGQKIQLYIYMKAVESSLKATPVGVFYLPIYVGFAGDNGSRYKYKGQVAESREIMTQLDSLAAEDPENSVVPYKANAKGELNPEIHLTGSEFDILGDYALRLAGEGAKQIAEGYIKPSPVKDGCDRCRYREICAYVGQNERKLSAARLSSFKETDESSEGEAEDNE